MTRLERLAQVATWLGQRWCGLRTGHWYVTQSLDGRMALVCCYCDHESTGWTLTEREDP